MSFRGEIIELAFRLPPRDGQFSIEHVGELALRENGRPFGLAEAGAISKYRKDLFSRLLQAEDERVRRGALQTFRSVSSSSLRVEWAKQHPSVGRTRALHLRSCCARWLDGLDDRSYEFAAGHAMQRLGAQRVEVTPGGNEWGIDFFAVVPAFARSPIFVSGKRGLRIVGQAKKYASPVAREKVQSFNDTLNSVRTNRAELTNLIPAWFRGASSPIVGCFVGHMGFQSGARLMANQAGLLLLDTLDLAEILGWPKGFDLRATDRDVVEQLWSGSRGLAA